MATDILTHSLCLTGSAYAHVKSLTGAISSTSAMFLTSHFCTYRIKLFHRGKKGIKDGNMEGCRKGENKVIATTFSLRDVTGIPVSLPV